MRPDPHKQAATRKYVLKQRAKGVKVESKLLPERQQKRQGLPSNDWRFVNVESDDDDAITRKLISDRNQFSRTADNSLLHEPSISSNDLRIDSKASNRSDVFFNVDLERLDSCLKVIPLHIRIDLDEPSIVSMLSGNYRNIADVSGRIHAKETERKVIVNEMLNAPVVTMGNLDIVSHSIIETPPAQPVVQASKKTEDLETWLDDLLDD